MKQISIIFFDMFAVRVSACLAVLIWTCARADAWALTDSPVEFTASWLQAYANVRGALTLNRSVVRRPRALTEHSHPGSVPPPSPSSLLSRDRSTLMKSSSLVSEARSLASSSRCHSPVTPYQPVRAALMLNLASFCGTTHL